MSAEKEAILKAARDYEVKFVSLQFTDIMGMLKTITVPLSKLENILENGIWFDGSSIQGFVRISESDMFLRPDVSTFAIIPWLSPEHRTARIICDVYTPDGDRFMGAPRNVLIKALEEAEAMGFEYRVGPELEFFLFETQANGTPIPGATHDKASYFDATSDRGALVREDMITALDSFGIDVEAGHHEVAAGQHEIDFRYGHALRTADAAVTFKFVLKAVAANHNLYATFMPKPIRGINGSGMHVHQSIADPRTGENLFYDPNDYYHLSKIAKQFIAGQLAHAKGMIAVLAPLVNSYKRLVPGYEAPVYISWAQVNRSALIRIPRTLSPSGTRLELRCPDPSCNPYLAFAVMLKCGLDGIKNDLPLPAPSEEDLYESEEARRNLEALPGSLKEAIEEMDKDKVVQEALGSHVYEHFREAKLREWEDYCLEVTEWELNHYFAIY